MYEVSQRWTVCVKKPWKRPLIPDGFGHLSSASAANYTINPMSYTKLDGSGNALPDSATTWVMVKDNVTGLIWEMKTNKDGMKNYNDPHDADNTYHGTIATRQPMADGRVPLAVTRKSSSLL